MKLSLNELSPILLVEENEADVYLTRRKLEADGVKNPLIVVSEVAEGIIFLKEVIRDPATYRQPCVIFTDLGLFRSNGAELIHWVRDRARVGWNEGCHSDRSSDPMMRKEAVELGVDHYLRKFPERGVFASIVAEAMSCNVSPEKHIDGPFSN